MSAASSGERTGYSIERVLSRPSISSAVEHVRRNDPHRSQSGRSASTAMFAMNVAKASFSQMPFHHRIVTRSPNHMWASSWATTSATARSSCCVALAGSTSRTASRYVISPRFSMAPAAKSGRATKSTFFSG